MNDNQPNSPRWEYSHLQFIHINAIREKLNEAGQQGWELVGVQFHLDTWHLFLKRPLA